MTNLRRLQEALKNADIMSIAQELDLYGECVKGEIMGKKLYKVNVGYDRLGRERNVRFYTESEARAACNAVHEKTGVILSIRMDNPCLPGQTLKVK